jgi:hypothetical protein
MVVGLIAWSLMWYAPWQTWLDSFRWIQVTLGIFLFILPGSGVYILLSQRKVNWSGIIPVGFVVSITLSSFLGVCARVFHLSFSFILTGYFLIGVVVIWCLSQNPRLVRIPMGWNRKDLLISIGLLLPVLIAVYSAAKLSIPPLIHDDDLSYNALLAYYRYADTLDFTDTVTHISRVRFWLAFWPLVEALIAHLGGMHGLLLTGIYLSPALSILSFWGIYYLGSIINLKIQYRLVAIVAQIGSLIRLTEPSHPGVAFFNIFTQDKNVAAFVLSFVVIAAAIEYLKKPTKKTLIIASLTLLGLGFTHPTVLGMTALILFIYGVINILITRQLTPHVILLLITFVVLIPHFSLRFFEEEGRRVYTVESEVDTMRDYKINPHRIRIRDNTKYFGISPEVVDGLPFTLLIIICSFSLTKLKKTESARYFSAILIVLGLIYIPYTGWLIGLAITPFHLWRIPRLFPFGLAMAYITQIGIQFIFERFGKLKKHEKYIHNLVSIFACLIILFGIYYILPWAKGNLGGSKPGFDNWYENYIEIGDYLNALEQPDVVIIGGVDSITNDIIPSLSIDAQLVSFRNENPGPNTDLWNSMVGEGTTIEDRLNLFNKFGINYILLREEVEWMEEIQDTRPTKFELIIENKKLRLYEFHP